MLANALPPVMFSRSSATKPQKTNTARKSPVNKGEGSTFPSVDTAQNYTDNAHLCPQLITAVPMDLAPPKLPPKPIHKEKWTEARETLSQPYGREAVFPVERSDIRTDDFHPIKSFSNKECMSTALYTSNSDTMSER